MLALGVSPPVNTILTLLEQLPTAALATDRSPKSVALPELTKLKDTKMKHIERMTRLVGTIACRIMYVDAERPYFDYQPIYYFHPFFGDDPFRPIAISYPLMNYKNLKLVFKL